MLFNDLIEKDKIVRSECNYYNNFIADKDLNDYFSLSGTVNFSDDSVSIVDRLCMLYLSIQNTENVFLLKEIIEKYNINYSASIRNAIIRILSRKSELTDDCLSFFSFPGIYGFNQEDERYQLDTILGSITVSKASSLFKKCDSNYIFCNHLINKCFSRTYDFVSQNKDSSLAVLAYMPYMFYGGHYHAYVECNDGILDIASNSFYSSKEDGDKVLAGRIIKKLDYFELEDEFNLLKDKYVDLKDSKYNKLLALSLHYDYR